MKSRLSDLIKAGINGMDYINKAILIIDSNHRIIYMNSNCEAMLKLKKEDVLNTNIYDVYPNAPEEVRHIENTVKFGETYKIDRMRYKFGDFDNYFSLETHLLKLDGEIVGGLAEFTDVTDFVEHEDKLRKSLSEIASNIILMPEKKGVLPLNQAVVDILELSELTETILMNVTSKRLKTLIVDLSAIYEASTAFFQSINILIESSRMIGVKVIITGIKPAVAQQMVNSGIKINHENFVNTLEKAF